LTRPIQRLYADCRGDVILIDGTPIGDWVRRLKRTVIYSDSWFDFRRHMLDFMEPDDEAFGTPKKITGVTLKTKTGSVRMMCGDSWGVDREDVDAMAKQIERTYDVVTNYGFHWSATAATTGMAILSRHAFHALSPGLPRRWHGLAGASIHAGPINHVKGYSGECTHIDRRRAYFSAMNKPMPCGELKRCDLKTALKQPSLIDAVVKIPWHMVPPLPVRTQRNRILYRYGRLRGCWPSNLLRVAMKHYGVEVE